MFEKIMKAELNFPPFMSEVSGLFGSRSLMHFALYRFVLPCFVSHGVFCSLINAQHLMFVSFNLSCNSPLLALSLVMVHRTLSTS